MPVRSLVLSVLLLLYATPCLADWGDAWGFMDWGPSPPSVPTVGGAGLILMALVFLVLGAAAQRLRAARYTAVVMVLLAPLMAFAVPNLFENGTVADADEVNENFADLEGALPLLAFSGETSVQRNNIVGTTSATLGSTTDRACFLTSVQFEDLDSNGEGAACRVIVSGSNWELQATLTTDQDADAWCRARCPTW
jgi:hypothetical protein